MQSDGTGGRVGGTQFDDKIVKGVLASDKPWYPRPVAYCTYCPKAFLPERFREHLEKAHGVTNG